VGEMNAGWNHRRKDIWIRVRDRRPVGGNLTEKPEGPSGGMPEQITKMPEGWTKMAGKLRRFPSAGTGEGEKYLAGKFYL